MAARPSVSKTGMVEEQIDVEKRLAMALAENEALNRTKPQIAERDLKIVEPREVLGNGANGEVVVGLYYGERVAVKQLFALMPGSAFGVLTPQEQRDVRRDLKREVDALARLRHMFLVTFYGYVCDADGLISKIVVELLEGVPRERAKLRPLPILYDVGRGLDYLHACRIVHRDVKLANILYDARTDAYKLSDLGEALILDRGTRTFRPRGSPAWVAPEIKSPVANVEPTTAADVFSFAVTAIEVLSGQSPNPSDVTHVMVGQAKQILPEVKLRGEDIKLIPAHLVELKQLIVRGLDDTPSERPVVREFCKYLATIMPPKIQLTHRENLQPPDTLTLTLAPADQMNMMLACRKAQTTLAVFRRAVMWRGAADASMYALQKELRETKLKDYADIHMIGLGTKGSRGTYGVTGRFYAVSYSEQHLVVNVLANLSTPHQAGDDVILLERLFGREWDLPLPYHPCIVSVLHRFRDSPYDLPGYPPHPDVAPGDPPQQTVFVVLPRYDGALSIAGRTRREAGQASERWLLSVMCLLLRGVQHLVRNNVLHMDLKLDNVWVRHAAFDDAAEDGVSRNMEVRVAELGCFIKVDDISNVPRGEILNRDGNPVHQAPEFRSRERLLDMSRAEVWAVGVMAHELVSGESPFGSQAPAAYVLGPQHVLPHVERVPLLALLVQAMLACKPVDRISVDDACLLAHALLYNAPLMVVATPQTVEGENAEMIRVISAWHDAHLTALHEEASNASASPGAGSLPPSVAWLSEAEYMCSLDVGALTAVARRWFASS